MTDYDEEERSWKLDALISGAKVIDDLYRAAKALKYGDEDAVKRAEVALTVLNGGAVVYNVQIPDVDLKPVGSRVLLVADCKFVAPELKWPTFRVPKPEWLRPYRFGPGTYFHEGVDV